MESPSEERKSYYGYRVQPYRLSKQKSGFRSPIPRRCLAVSSFSLLKDYVCMSLEQRDIIISEEEPSSPGRWYEKRHFTYINPNGILGKNLT